MWAWLELYAIIAALYLLECVVVLRRTQCVFWRFIGRRWRWVQAARLPGPLARGLFLGMPLPPLGEIHVASPWPLSLSPEGVTNARAEQLDHGAGNEDSARHFTLDACENVAAFGTQIVIDGVTLAHAATESQSGQLAKLIRRLIALRPEERAAAIDAALAPTCDGRQAREIVARLREASVVLRWLCNALLVYVFAVLPGIIWWKGLGTTWPVLLAATLALWWLTVFEYYRTHRVACPAAISERRGRLVLLLLTPLAAMRAHHMLLRDRLAEFHPLAAGAALLDEAEFEQLAGATLRDLHHPARFRETDNPEALGVADWFRDRLRERAEAVTREKGADVAALLAAPVRDDPEARSFCARCRQESTHDTGECPNCPGVALVRFGAAPSQTQRQACSADESGTSGAET